MDLELNPYTPGSGRQPPALTGRQGLIDAFDLVVARSRRGHTDRGLMLSGLRGVGKTALLNYLRTTVAEPADWVTISLEAQATRSGAAAVRHQFGRELLTAVRRFSHRRRAEHVLRTLQEVIGSFTVSVGPVAIARSRLERVAQVLMQTEGRDIGSAASELERRLKSDGRSAGIRWRFVGQVDLMRTTFGGLGLAVTLAIMVVFMIMASQFKSLRLPFVMLFTIPVALLGIVLALLAGGQRFSVTSLATVIGLIPTALSLDVSTASNRPLALAVVGGLTSSTVLSLFLVPIMFLRLARRPLVDFSSVVGASHSTEVLA